jgi:uncharacterized membrane protein YphA (DoxX/SURF4 family)
MSDGPAPFVTRGKDRTPASANGGMSTTTVPTHRPFGTVTRLAPVAQATLLLRVVFAAAPILVGLDKFSEVLTSWPKYLAPAFNDVIPGTATQAMHAVGVVEVLAGVLVAVRPRLGAPLVAAWLAGIVVNLLVLGDYYDVAVRDLGLMVGALALWRLVTAPNR